MGVLRNAVGRGLAIMRERFEARAVAAAIRRPPGGEQFHIGPLRVRPDQAFLDLDIEIGLTWEQTRNYQYSKLYYASEPGKEFNEADCICFRLQCNGRTQRVRLLLPEPARSTGWLTLRFDPLPYAQGVARLHRCRLASSDDRDAALSAGAAIDALKRHTQLEVVNSEATGRAVLPHYPESLSLEIQPGCNLTCPHCSSHGTRAEHQRHNALGEIDSALLAKLAHEVFPHLSNLCIVGRGEPLLASDKLWSELIAYLREYRILITIMTNGCFLERRITDDVLPLIDTLGVSMDGLNAATFAHNRRGANFEQVLAGVRRFHALRKRVCLPRRPKLCFSWTLKKNNIAEFPDFVRRVAELEPDRFAVRHLLLFHESQREESLLEIPQAANRYLREAYGLLQQYGIETDCPPLFEVAPEPAPAAHAEAGAHCGATPNASDSRVDRACVYIHRTACLGSRGEMSVCGAPYAERVGDLASAADFWSLWNGPVMQAVRRDLNTPSEQFQCRDCWYRQSHYHAQRQARAERRAYSLSELTSLSKKAWDFRIAESPAGA